MLTTPARWWWLLLAVPLAAGCGGGARHLSTQEAEKQAVSMLQEKVDSEHLKVRYYVGNPRCVKDGDQRWQCVVEVDPEGADPISMSGTLTCDGRSCIWKPA